MPELYSIRSSCQTQKWLASAAWETQVPLREGQRLFKTEREILKLKGQHLLNVWKIEGSCGEVPVVKIHKTKLCPVLCALPLLDAFQVLSFYLIGAFIYLFI